MTDTAYNIVAKELACEQSRNLKLFEENMALQQENKQLKEDLRAAHKQAEPKS